MTPSEPTALIVGAGIGGLAAGVALLRAGWNVRVYERADNPRALGFALALAPNAMAALAELGLADAIIAEGVPTTKTEVRHGDGRLIRAFALPLGGKMVVALRQALHGALLNAVGRERVILGSPVVAVAATRDHASLTLADGRTDAGDVLVGADGVASVVRKHLHPNENDARPSGFSALRGVAYDAGSHLGDLAAVAYLGDGVEAATVRASRDAVYWYVSLVTRDIGSGAREPRAVLERQTASLDPRFRAVAAATRAEDMRFDELFQRPPLATWGARRLTLLGDAAHPVLPHTGQGAAQALEDAVALGLALGDAQSVEDALRRYEAVRSPRTRRFVALGPRIARVTTTRQPVVQALRTAAIRVLPESLLAKGAVGLGSDPHAPLRRHSRGFRL